jgi:hypothetical protein
MGKTGPARLAGPTFGTDSKLENLPEYHYLSFFKEMSMARHRGIQIVIRQRGVWLILLLLLGITGCGGGRGTISGKVKYKGNLLPSGRLVFVDSKDRQVASASINNDGSYSAIVPTGTMKLAVMTPPPSIVKSLPKEKSTVILEGVKRMKKGGYNPLESEKKDDLLPTKSIAVPANYADATTSGLTLEVLGGPQSFDIDLQ